MENKWKIAKHWRITSLENKWKIAKHKIGIRQKLPPKYHYLSHMVEFMFYGTYQWDIWMKNLLKSIIKYVMY